MSDIIIDTFMATKKTMVQNSAKKNYNSFELLGYDFLLDEDLRI